MQALSRFFQHNFGRFWLAAVYLFLYIPLFFLIIFSSFYSFFVHYM